MVRFLINILISTGIILLYNSYITPVIDYGDSFENLILFLLILSFVGTLISLVFRILILPFTLITFGLFSGITLFIGNLIGLYAVDFYFGFVNIATLTDYGILVILLAVSSIVSEIVNIAISA